MADPVVMKSIQKFKIKVGKFFSAEDPPREAKVEGPPFIAYLPENDAVRVVPTEDGMEAEVLGMVMVEDAPSRACRITLRADANRDPGVQKFIERFVDVLVTAPVGPEAATMEIEVGALEDQ